MLFLRRYWYFFVVLWILAGETESFSTNALLQLYMKSHPTTKYTISQVNNYPTGVPAVGIVSTLFWATLTDFMGGKRYLGKRPRGDEISGRTDRLTQLSRLLDSYHGCHNKCIDPGLPAKYIDPLRHVLLGWQRLCLSGHFLCLGK